MGKLFCLSLFGKKSKVAKAMQCAEMTQNPQVSRLLFDIFLVLLLIFCVIVLSDTRLTALQLMSGKNTMNLAEVFADANLSVGTFINDPSDQSPHSVDREKAAFHANGFSKNVNTDIDGSGVIEDCISDSSQSRMKDDDAANLADFSNHSKVPVGKGLPDRMDTEISGPLQKSSIMDRPLDNANAQITENTI